MPELTSRERILRLFARKPIDTMPCFSGQGMVTVPAIASLGLRFPQIHLSAENMTRAALASMEMYGFDAAVVPFDMCVIPEAFGLEISMYEDVDDILYPTIARKWDTPEAVAVPGDIDSRGRMPVVDQAIKTLKQTIGRTHAVGTWLLGPFTLAGQLLELDVLMKMAIKERTRLELLLDRLTNMIIELGLLYREIGADYVSVREMGTGSDLLSPRVFKTIVQPRLQRIFAAWESPKILHICGSTDLIITLMNDCGAEVISVDHKNTLTKSREAIGNEVLLFGDYDGFKLPRTASPIEIEQAIRVCIESGVDAVWPGCDIWPDITPENLYKINDTIRDLGRSPSPVVGRL